jgi:lipopolysaccharide/colanic/teichoic acid biosynthesis glycosyltransferase
VNKGGVICEQSVKKSLDLTMVVVVVVVFVFVFVAVVVVEIVTRSVSVIFDLKDT